MDVRCERCKTQYELDDSRISETGVTVQCTTCHHVFVVKKKALVVTVPVRPDKVPSGPVSDPSSAPPPSGMRPLSPPIDMPPPVASASPPPAAPPPAASEPASLALPPGAAGPGAREWRVRQASGNLFTFKDLTTLQKWIVERKVARGDEISLTGDAWKRLGDIAELATFFQLVDEAQKAAVLQAQVDLSRTPAVAPLPLQLSAPSPVVAAPSPPPAQLQPQPQAQPQRSRWPLVLVALVLVLGGGAAGYHFLVTVPRQEEEARRVAAAKLEAERLEKERLEKERLEAERLEKERQAQLLAAQAAAEALLQADAGSSSADGGDGGSAAGSAPNAGSASDAGVAHDAGAKKPAPVRDFDFYMTQADRLRERDKSEQALEAYGQAAELAPDRAEPYSGRGMALLDMGDPRQAEPEFKQALKINPNYAEAIIGLAETYRSQGKKAEAIRYYERYLEILPDGPESPVAKSAIERLKE